MAVPTVWIVIHFCETAPLRCNSICINKSYQPQRWAGEGISLECVYSSKLNSGYNYLTWVDSNFLRLLALIIHEAYSQVNSRHEVQSTSIECINYKLTSSYYFFRLKSWLSNLDWGCIWMEQDYSMLPLLLVSLLHRSPSMLIQLLFVFQRWWCYMYHYYSGAFAHATLAQQNTVWVINDITHGNIAQDILVLRKSSAHPSICPPLHVSQGEIRISSILSFLAVNHVATRTFWDNSKT